MANAQIFITGPGAGSHIGWFLPRGATMIRIYPEEWMLEHHLFPHMSHMHVDHVNASAALRTQTHLATRGIFDHAEVLRLVRLGLRRFERAGRSAA
jgi:hypothetical protein